MAHRAGSIAGDIRGTATDAVPDPNPNTRSINPESPLSDGTTGRCARVPGLAPASLANRIAAPLLLDAQP